MASQLPLWPKIFLTLFVCVLVPVYWAKYGPTNFLWYSDVALFLTVAALWRESRLLLSMAAVGTLLPESAWCVDFLLGLLLGRSPFGLAGYMFDPGYALYLRGLSLFHLILPPLWIWMLHRLGHDNRAWIAQSILGMALLLVTYAITDPARNINWVFGPGAAPQTFMPPLLYLAIMVAGAPLAIFLPTHLLLRWWFGKRGEGNAAAAKG